MELYKWKEMEYNESIGINILTCISLAQVKARNTSDTLFNEIRQNIYSFASSKINYQKSI